MELSHINASGEANMVDVGDKQLTNDLRRPVVLSGCCLAHCGRLKVMA